MKEALSTMSRHGAWLDSAQTCLNEHMVSSLYSGYAWSTYFRLLVPALVLFCTLDICLTMSRLFQKTILLYAFGPWIHALVQLTNHFSSLLLYPSRAPRA
ncbi:uncharacterized protein P174DRAFT_217724 [Aspergillus novofumigatus IBT 16806]|uniref:Uncharacterized protein n=1 Tax=Aspergillus novofumigatus (strain IBT 16806) TaxID=1392255 RepID=A0A2I1C5Z2_ASPN1|nr:uncharacterized protein P174DRAFT_217724 [Aspergillus novofumigatus IBT 16806]PKX92981.1 hypothetical protein P174DRAFT_217724 [Aspergillus novofumigatus IBT 16806]